MAEDVTLLEVKEAIDEQNKDFKTFRDVNDRRLKDLEEKGSSDTLDEEQLARINKGLDAMEDVQKGFKSQKDI